MRERFCFKTIFFVTIILTVLSTGCWPEEEESTQPLLLDSGFNQIDDETDSGIEPTTQNFDSGISNNINPDDASVDGGNTLSGSMQDAGIIDVHHDGGMRLSEDDYVPLTTDTCAELCLARIQNSGGFGGCDFSWNSGDCETRCMEVAPFSELTQTAFAYCTLYDPLCYQTVDQCLLAQRYPWSETMQLPMTFSGTGFDAYNGFRITVAIQSMANVYDYAPEQFVIEGAFELEWEVETNPNMSNLFLYYIDVDADGHCDTNVDYGGSLHGEMGPDWDAPAIFAEEVFDNNNHEFVCDYID